MDWKEAMADLKCSCGRVTVDQDPVSSEAKFSPEPKSCEPEDEILSACTDCGGQGDEPCVCDQNPSRDDVLAAGGRNEWWAEYMKKEHSLD